MSTADASSHITHANAAFMAVSGYASDEVLGQAHNVVRHPDMPPETFADMGATLKAGESWTALVKNRRKNGDHYGVRANATPVARNGQAVGYMSVRTRPGRDEVAAAEKRCAEFNAGQAGNRAVHKGLLVRTRLMASTSLLQTMPLRWCVRLGVLAIMPASLPGAALAATPSSALIALAAASATAMALALWWLEAQVTRPMERVAAQARKVAAATRAAACT